MKTVKSKCWLDEDLYIIVFEDEPIKTIEPDDGFTVRYESSYTPVNCHHLEARYWVYENILKVDDVYGDNVFRIPAFLEFNEKMEILKYIKNQITSTTDL